jgi:hypothetical protein
MRFIGWIPSGHSLPKLTKIKRPVSVWFGVIPSNQEKILALEDSKYSIATPSSQNMDFSYQSLDFVGQWSFSKSNTFKLALDFLETDYITPFDTFFTSDDEFIPDLDLSTSPVFPYTLMGFRTKRDLFQSPYWKEWREEFKKEIVIYNTSGKVEIKETDLVKKNKIRLFAIPPAHLLMSQLRFGKGHSLSIKEYRWSAYGFNPYCGGANNMAQRLLSKPIRLFYDVSGWDKFLPVLPYIYALIRKKIPEAHIQEFNWMADNTCTQNLKTVWGEVYSRPYGNASGTGTTTRDNILAHVIILSDALIKAYYAKFNSYPSVQQIRDQVVFLFGDDSIMALDADFDYVLKENFLSDHFSSYGMTLKFMHGGIDFPLKKMQFLGFNFISKGDKYLPLYDVQRLAASLIIKTGSDERSMYLSKLFAIYVMSWPTPHHDLFKRYAREFVAQVFRVDIPKEDSTLISLINRDDVMESFFFGWENNDAEFPFFSASLADGGFKILRDVSL